MRKILYGTVAVIVLLITFTACNKDKSITDDTNNQLPPTGPLQLYMTDYYPDSFYHNYSTLNITSDSANIKLKFVALNNFQFKNVRLVVGDEQHLKDILSPFTTPPLSEKGPQPFDYEQTFTNSLPDSCTFTIPRSGLKSKTVYIYAWAYVEKHEADGTLTDWHSSWARTDLHVNGDAATSYIQYTMQ